MKNRTKELRIKNGMSQKELAEKIQTIPRNLRFIEQGHHLSLEMALKISRILNVSVEELVMPDPIKSDSIISSVQSPENSVEQAM